MTDWLIQIQPEAKFPKPTEGVAWSDMYWDIRAIAPTRAVVAEDWKTVKEQTGETKNVRRGKYKDYRVRTLSCGHFFRVENNSPKTRTDCLPCGIARYLDEN